MSNVTASNDIFSQLGLAQQQTTSTPENDPSQLGLDTFLTLMVTQLNNQDPFKPMENGDFLAQIAQFGSVTGLDRLNQQMEDLSASLTSGQALQAGSLVGREVLVPLDVGYLGSGEALQGRAQLDQSSSEITLRVFDQTGQQIREMSLGSGEPGDIDFSWDGMQDDGTYAVPGQYQVQVSAKQGQSSVDLYTELKADVESVTMSGTQGLTLNLAGLGPVSFNNVSQIF